MMLAMCVMKARTQRGKSGKRYESEDNSYASGECERQRDGRSKRFVRCRERQSRIEIPGHHGKRLE